MSKGKQVWVFASLGGMYKHLEDSAQTFGPIDICIYCGAEVVLLSEQPTEMGLGKSLVSHLRDKHYDIFFEDVITEKLVSVTLVNWSIV